MTTEKFFRLNTYNPLRRSVAVRQCVAQRHTATPGERIVRSLPLEALMAESLINILDPVSE
jgi:hypothetical protein